MKLYILTKGYSKVRPKGSIMQHFKTTKHSTKSSNSLGAKTLDHLPLNIKFETFIQNLKKHIFLKLREDVSDFIFRGR